MNNFLFNKITDKSLPVVCTKHAIDRAVQRCKLLMRQHERDNPRLFLLDIFKKTNPHMGVIFSPFAYNKLCSIYGSNSFIRHNDKFMLMCRYDNKANQVIIKSIIYKRNSKFYF